MSIAARAPALAGQIVELDTARGRIAMIAAADDDDAALAGRHHAIEQLVREDEVSEVVDHELLFDAVHLLPVIEHDARVQDEHIDRVCIERI